MVGRIEWDNGRKLTAERSVLYGVPLLRVGLPVPKRGGARATARAVRKGANYLWREGCRRVLADVGFAAWDLLAAVGLRPVEPEPLLQAMAAPLCFAGLAQGGIAPERAVVALCGERVTESFSAAAEALCPAVRSLIISAQSGGDALRAYLYREYGASVLDGIAAGRADLTLCFSPGAPAGAPRLELFAGGSTLGLTLRHKSLPPPDGIAPLPCLTLLWETGAVQAEDIVVTQAKADASAVNPHEHQENLIF
ncbi:MAG: hypothetical protein LUG13_07450 [Oscillospiraceae bacterium]|nr:hypothetical protein [Oscillospiraceae bacterium]